jgi:hypothetical protein
METIKNISYLDVSYLDRSKEYIIIFSNY